MIVKIENTNHAYAGNGIVNVNATVTIYADDGVTVLHQRGISSSANTNDTSVDANGVLLWKTRVISDLQTKAQAIVDIYDATMKAVGAAWPTATTPQEVLDLLATDVESGIVVPV